MTRVFLLLFIVVTTCCANGAHSEFASFDWKMSNQYGTDQNGDHRIDVNSALMLANLSTGSYSVEFFYNGPTPVAGTTYRWYLKGPSFPGGFSISKSAREFDTSLEEGLYDVSLTVSEPTIGEFSSSQKVVIKNVLIVTVGDSYASGEGNPEIPRQGDDADATWADDYLADPFTQIEHRSTSAASSLAVLDLIAANPKVNYSFIFLAQSGATITDNDGGKSLLDGTALIPSQLQRLKIQMSTFRRKEIDHLIISIGGNDIGFGDAVKALIGNTIGALPDLSPFGRLSDRFQRLDSFLDSNFSIHNTYITEYPTPLNGCDGIPPAVQGTDIAPEVLWFADLNISAWDAMWADEHLLRPLNGLVKKAAFDALQTHPSDVGQLLLGANKPWHYVDGIYDAFRTHGYSSPPGFESTHRTPLPGQSLFYWSLGATENECARWIRTATESRLLQSTDDDSPGIYHPNTLGHRVIADHLLEKLSAEINSELPKALPGGPYLISAGKTITLRAGDSYTDESVANSDLVYLWEFDGDGEVGSSESERGREVTLDLTRVAAPAKKEIKLFVYNPHNFTSSTASTYVEIQPAQPANRVFGEQMAEAGLPYDLTVEVMLGYYDVPWRTAKRWRIDWGDGTSGGVYAINPRPTSGYPPNAFVESQTFQHSFLTTGTFNVTVTVTESATDFNESFSWNIYSKPIDVMAAQDHSAGISGRIYQDRDANRLSGVRDAPLEGAIVYLDTNFNGRRDAGERWARSDIDGAYLLPSLKKGTYDIRLELPEDPNGWPYNPGFITSPYDGRYENVQVSDQLVIKGVDFLAYYGTTITGRVTPTDSSPVPNLRADTLFQTESRIQVFIDLNWNYQCDPGEPATFVHSDGTYEFYMPDGFPDILNGVNNVVCMLENTLYEPDWRRELDPFDPLGTEYVANPDLDYMPTKPNWPSDPNDSLSWAFSSQFPVIIPNAGLMTTRYYNGNAPITIDEIVKHLSLSSRSVLDGLGDPNIPAASGKAAIHRFYALAGSVLSFNWDFLTSETLGRPQDSAFVCLDGSNVVELAKNDSALSSGVGSYERQTEWNTHQISVPKSGWHTIAFGVLDEGDEMGDSALAVKNVRLFGTPFAKSGYYNRPLQSFKYPEFHVSLGSAVIRGKVWDDSNEDGVIQTQELGVPGTKIELFSPGFNNSPADSDDVLIDTTYADSSGEYVFSGLRAGLYFLVYSPPAGFGFGRASSDLIQGDSAGSANISDIIELPLGGSITNRPLGLVAGACDIVVSQPIDTLTSEIGDSIAFKIKLSRQPRATVVIPLSSTWDTEGAVSANQLLFSPETWNIEQTITVSGQDDFSFDGPQQYYLAIGPTVSTDSSFNALPVRYFAITNVDNEGSIPVDAFEPNESEGTSADLGAGPVTVTALTLHTAGDVDWFRWRANVAGEIRFVLNYDSDLSNPTLSVFDSNLKLLGSSGSRFHTNHTVKVEGIKSASEFLIRVSSPDDRATPLYELNIDAVSGSPLIVTSPENQMVLSGRPVRFEIVAIGDPPLSYQWQLNSVNLDRETNSWIEIQGLTENLVGRYSVIVSNSLGSIRSQTANLTMIKISPTSNPISLQLFGPVGTHMTLEQSIEVSSGAWSQVGKLDFSGFPVEVHSSTNRAASLFFRQSLVP